MLSGVCLNDESSPNLRIARRLASFIFKLQQKKKCYPVQGAAQVPARMFTAFRPPVKPEPYDPRNHLPSQIQAGCHRNVPANIDLYTMGFDSLTQRCHEMMKKKLHLDIPVHDVFHCLDLKGNVPKHHLWRCTGRNAKMFQSGWYHKNIRPLVRKVLRNYDDHNKNRSTGENYRVAFFCKSGNYRSVAVATGLQTMLIGMGYKATGSVSVVCKSVLSAVSFQVGKPGKEARA